MVAETSECENSVTDDSDEEEIKDSTRDPSTYVAKAPRFFFHCKSDEHALNKMLKTFKDNKNASDAKQVVATTFQDSPSQCRCCGDEVRVSTVSVKFVQKSVLHTLHHGSIDVHVTDWIRSTCEQFNAYDGLSDALFRTTKNHVFTRELLDVSPQSGKGHWALRMVGGVALLIKKLTRIFYAFLFGCDDMIAVKGCKSSSSKKRDLGTVQLPV